MDLEDMMRNSHSIYLKISILLIATLLFGCSKVSSNQLDSEEANKNQKEEQNSGDEGSKDSLKNTPESFINNMSEDLSEEGLSFDSWDYYTDYNEREVNYIQLNESSIVFSGEGAFVSDNIISISKPGTYVVFGMLKDGQIVVEEKTGGLVRLILKDAIIHCEKGAPIDIKEAGKVMISLVPGTRNVLTDGISEDNSLSNTNATIYCESDLTLNGSGRLVMNAMNQNAIVSEGVLKMVEGDYEIRSVAHGIIGEEAVLIDAAKMKITSGKDGIRTSNDSVNSKGLIFMNRSEFVISSKQDGIQADKNLVVQDGVFTLNSEEDAIHSDGSISIKNGTFTIASGDDGIHADRSLSIAMADITITSSYEGIEGSMIHIKSGKLNIVSTDDGINVSGGSDGNKENSKEEEDSFMEGEGMLSFSGGTVTVYAGGDGIDINGSATMTGGTLIIEGPTNHANGAIDYDGVFEISGGTLLAVGSRKMAMAPSNTSKQNSLLLNLEEVIEEETLLCLLEGEDRIPVMAYLPSKSYQSIVYSSPLLEEGKSYTLSTGGNTTPKEAMNIYTPKAYEEGIDQAYVTINGTLTTYGELKKPDRQLLDEIIE